MVEKWHHESYKRRALSRRFLSLGRGNNSLQKEIINYDDTLCGWGWLTAPSRMCWHATRQNLCEYMRPCDRLQIEPSHVPTRVFTNKSVTDEGVYRQGCLPTKITSVSPLNWWTNIQTRINPLLTFVPQFTTIACLWFVLSQTSPDYGVWNCLGENPSDIPMIIVL